MATREQLHREVDALPDAQVSNARILLEDPEAEAARRAEIDRAIIDSYQSVPQEDLGATWAIRESIREEPWERRPKS
jgi:hypothetical protein